MLCLGYKGDLIKKCFLDYPAQVSDFTLHMGTEQITEFHGARTSEDWEVTFAETGLLTGTGARLRRVAKYLDSDTFLLTYGDGIGDVDLWGVLATHLSGGELAGVDRKTARRYVEAAVAAGLVRESRSSSVGRVCRHRTSSSSSSTAGR